MRRIELAAWSSTVVTGLAEPDVRALAASRAVDVLPSREPGSWEMRAGAHVGVLLAGETELCIRPRITIARLIYLLGYAKDPGTWTDDPVGLDDLADLWPAMAQVFVRQAEKALERGVLQGYRTEESAQLVMRGRLREADQLRARAGLPIPLEVRFDEYDNDIPENQLLRAAAERLVRMPDIPTSITRRLRHTIGRLADVSRLIPGQPSPHVHLSRLNERYRPALSLARMILAARSIDIANSEVRATGFLVNMNTAFEEYVTAALTRALGPFGGRCQPQDTSHRMDVGGAVRLKPDLVRYGSDGRPQTVIDAKYKAESPSGFPYADLYQLLAYCTATQVSVGHLIYAEGDAADHGVAVRNTPVVIRRHVVGLHQPVHELQARIGRCQAV